MKKILLTGSTGFVGRNILPYLQREYEVSAPTRLELDLLDEKAVYGYLNKGNFDAVVHLANPTGHNPVDRADEMLDRSLRVFSGLERCSELYGKMLYLGSGAEYGKHRDISSIKEEEFGEEIPKDAYGFARYIMSELAEGRDNIVNFRLFACCGPGDPPHKLIPYIIRCIKTGGEIKLKQDVWFDFLYVDDIYPVLKRFIGEPAKYKEYNLCSGKRVLISEIAGEVKRRLGSSAEVVFQKDGLNLEYTGSNVRLRAESEGWEPRSIGESVKEILKKRDFE
jgi:GDP-L-fucose synthase